MLSMADFSYFVCCLHLLPAHCSSALLSFALFLSALSKKRKSLGAGVSWGWGGVVPGMCPRSHTDVPRTLHVQRNRGDARPEQQTPHRDSPYVLVRTLAPSASSQLLPAVGCKAQKALLTCFILFLISVYIREVTV
jgi:hypothetical protein